MSRSTIYMSRLLSMTIPLIVLAILSAIAGMIGVPAVMGGHHELGAYLAPVFEQSKKY
jgi:NADH-quinone oxidoreductase subunit L